MAEATFSRAPAAEIPRPADRHAARSPRGPWRRSRPPTYLAGARDGAVRAGEAPSRGLPGACAGAGPLPKYVVEGFRGDLACGDFARGFVYVMCTSCGDDMAVSFSCKLRRVGSAIGIGRARRRQNATYAKWSKTVPISAEQPTHLAVTTNSYSVLDFPAGTYRITRTLITTRALHNDYLGVSIIGEDPATTTLVWDGAADQILMSLDA